MTDRITGDGGPRAVVRRILLASGTLRARSVAGDLNETRAHTFGVEPGENLLAVNYTGTLLLTSSSGGERLVLPSRSATFLHGPASVNVHYARGHHSGVELTWRSESASGLDRWVRTERSDSGNGIVAGLSWAGLGHRFADTLARIREDLRRPGKETEPQLLGAIHEIVGAVLVGDAHHGLAVIPEEAPEPLRELMREVKSRSSETWSLKEAAHFVGCSPFHLSRTFRSVVDFGFPEFVDRCRTEVAVRMLLAGDQGIEDLATACGFGSTQALRESTKEYLGFLPSELRSLPV